MSEPDRWLEVKKQMGDKQLVLGPRLADLYFHAPRQILYAMTWYKFAAKMIGPGKRVLDLGCGEGLGTYLLAVEAGKAQGVDSQADAIASAKQNFGHDPRVSFTCGDASTLPVAAWDALVDFRALDGQHPAWNPLKASLAHDGLLVLGAASSSPALTEVKKHFCHVFMFTIVEENILPGALAQGRHMIAVGCRKTKR